MQNPASPSWRQLDKIALVYPVATFMPPLGLLTLWSILERMGKEVNVVPLYRGLIGLEKRIGEVNDAMCGARAASRGPCAALRPAWQQA